jgi:CRP-like cAMP-binding protein
MAEDVRLRRLSAEIFFTGFFRGESLGFEPWLLDRITPRLREVDVRRGDTVYREGEPPRALVLMTSGRLRATRTGAPSYVFDGRWVLGTLDLLAARPRARTLTALIDTHTVELDAEAWLDLMEDSFEAARGAFMGNARSVANLNLRLAPSGGFVPPSHLRAVPMTSPLSFVDRLAAITEIDLLRGASVQTLADLADATEEIVLDDGQLLFARDSAGAKVFLVIDGLVEASRERPSLAARFGPGQMVAGAASLGTWGAPWEARALMRTRVLTLSIERLLDEMEDHFDLLRSLLTRMSFERDRLFDLLALRATESGEELVLT